MHNSKTALFAATLLALAIGTLAQETKSSPINIPGRDKILATLSKDHPRLIATKATFQELRARVQTDDQLKKWHQNLQEQGRKILNDPPSKYEIPDGLRLLATSRRVLGRIQTLGVLFQISREKQYVDRAWNELEAAAHFPDWNPRHFLDTAEMSHAFAIGYDWFFSEWTPEQKKIIRTALIEKGLNLGLGVYRGTAKFGSWHKARHNWNQVCNGGIGIGALALAEEEPALAGEILENAANSIQLAMAEFAPDGAWAEGPGYWNYATIYNVAFLAALETALGSDLGLSSIPGFGEAGMFPIYLTGPLGRTFNYADGGDGTIRAAQMFWLAKEFNQPACANYQSEVSSGHPLDLVWYQKSDSTAPLPLDKYFRNAEVVTFRSDWKNREAWFVGFKAGDNKANHSNLDLGTFVLDAQGVRWGVDLGADNYNLPAYFGGKRWSYYRMRAEGHNTLVINPHEEPDQDPKAATKILKFRNAKEQRFAQTDLTAAYKKNAKSVLRGLYFLETGLLVQDEIETLQPSSIWWFFHTPAEIELSNGNKTALLTLDGKKLKAELRSPSQAEFQILPAAPLPGLPNPEGQNKNAGIRKLSIQLKDSSSARIAVLFADENKNVAQNFGKTALADW